MDIMTLVAKLVLDSSQFEKGITDAAGVADDSGAKVTKAITGAAAAGAAALGAFAVTSVKTGQQFDSSMSQVAATLGKTMSELESEVGSVDTAYGHFSGNLREYAKFMGSNTVFSATQAADALNYMALAGYDAQKSMDMLPNVLNLAAAGGMELATASDMITDAESALSLKGSEVTDMVNQMAMAASKSNTSVSQLGEAILTIGGTASYMSGGTDRLNTVLGVLADNGIKGSEAGTHLRNMLLKLAAPTKEGTEWIKRLGINVFDAEGNMRDFAEIFPELNTAMSSLTDEEKMQALSEIFNARDIAAANALMCTTAERWEELGGYIADAGEAAQQMADTQLDNLAGDITLLKSAFEGVQIAVSDKLTPALRTAVQWLTTALERFDIILPIVVALTTALGGLAVALNFSKIVKSVTTTISGLSSVLSFLAANPVVAVGIALAALVTGLITLYNTNEEFREKVNAIWRRIKEIFSGAIEFIKTVTTEGFDKVKRTVSEKFDAIKKKIQEVIDAIKKLIPNWMKDMKSSVTEGLKGVTSAFGSAFGGLTNTIGSALSNAFDSVKSWIQKIKSYIDNTNLDKNVNVNIYENTYQNTRQTGSAGYITPNLRAYENVVEFKQPTVLATPNGYQKFGDGAGPELVMSKSTFYDALDRVNGDHGAVVININGYNHDPVELAEEVAEILGNKETMRRVAYG